MTYKWLWVVAFLALSSPTPAEACEVCALRFIDQTQTFCHTCEWSYCGYFDCVVRSDAGAPYCDTAWEDDDGGEDCFTSEGVATHRCGPRVQDPNAENLILTGGWRLVRSSVKFVKSLPAKG